MPIILRGIVLLMMLMLLLRISIEPIPSTTPLTVEQARANLESLALRTPYLALASVLYNRPHHLFRVANPRDERRHRIALAEVASPEYSKEVLLSLAAHADPKVRTLAIAGLFGREDPSVLPLLVKMCDDSARTFDGHPELAKDGLTHTGIGPPSKIQTVGDFATSMVRFYTKEADYGAGAVQTLQARFKEYWAARRTRSFCASWFAVQLVRACRGSHPTPRDCVDKVRAVRRKIDALPADDRAWTLLWLYGDCEELADEKELVQICRELGPQKLLLMLRSPSQSRSGHPT